ncbi:MAG: hypothetical protein PVI30_11565 [Myxococcales bacterium]
MVAATAGQPRVGDHPGQPALRLVVQPPQRKRHSQATLVAEVRGVTVAVFVRSEVDEVHGAA